MLAEVLRGLLAETERNAPITEEPLHSAAVPFARVLAEYDEALTEIEKWARQLAGAVASDVPKEDWYFTGKGISEKAVEALAAGAELARELRG